MATWMDYIRSPQAKAMGTVLPSAAPSSAPATPAEPDALQAKTIGAGRDALDAWRAAIKPGR